MTRPEPPARPRLFYALALAAIAFGLVAALQIAAALEGDIPRPHRSLTR